MTGNHEKVKNDDQHPDRREISKDARLKEYANAGHDLDHARRGLCRNDLREQEAARLKQRLILSFRTIAAAGTHQHHEVEKLAVRSFVPGRDEQELGRFGHYTAAVFQDLRWPEDRQKGG